MTFQPVFISLCTYVRAYAFVFELDLARSDMAEPCGWLLVFRSRKIPSFSDDLYCSLVVHVLLTDKSIAVEPIRCKISLRCLAMFCRLLLENKWTYQNHSNEQLS